MNLRSRPGNTRVVGLIVALLVAIAILALMGWFIFGPRGEAAREAARRAAIESAEAAPPDITSLPTGKGGGSGKEIHIQLVDKQNPGRVASEVFLPSVEPLENRRYLVQRPEAWFYLKDGKSVHIRADRGNLRLPSRDALPESGLLEGGVLVRVFEPTIDGTRPQPGRDVPVVDARAETLQFDGTLGELTTPDILRVDGRGVSFTGSQMRAIFNEVQQQIELLTFQKVTQFVYNPRLAASAPKPLTQSASAPKSPPVTSAGASDSPATSVAANPASPPPNAKPTTLAKNENRSTLYRANAHGDVVLTQGKRVARGSLMDVFALVTDGRLPALRSPASATPAPPASEPAKPQSSSTPIAASSATAPSPQAAATAPTNAIASSSSTDEVVSLEFTGPLEIRAVAERPASLGDSNLALTFVGDAKTKASVVDGVDGNAAKGDRLTYFADTQTAHLLASFDDGVELISPSSGTAIARDVVVNLASGSAAFNGPGLLRTGPNTRADQRGELTWRDHARFSFVVRDGKMTSLLRDAALEGSVLAKSDAGELRASTIQATLTPTAERSRLTSLALAGNARAADTRGGSLEGQSIIVQFLEGSDAAIPTSAVAIGSVTATRGTSRLQSGELEASFLTSAADKGKVDRVIAKDNVRFTGADGVAASCDLLTAFANDQLADLEGQMVTLSQSQPGTSEFAAVTGTKMRLEGLAGRLTVFGAGVFRQEGLLDDTPDAQRGMKAIARWSQGMTYDDTTGQLDASGDTEAQAFSSPLSYDELKSQQIKLLLTKGSAPAQSAGDGLGLLTQPLPPNSPDAAQRKQLITATAIGSAQSPASVTSRRFAVGTPRDSFATAQPEMLMYLQGAVITADNAAGTLNVPGEGKLLVVDRRPENSKPAAQTTDTLANIAGGKSGSRGNSLFDWKGSLSVAKVTNTLTMSKTVRLIHTPADTNQPGAELECDTLTAELLSQSGSPSADSAEPSLRKVNAEGAVFAKSGKREVVADAVTYDAVLRRMEAWSKGVNMVTATDPGSATPITAQALFWDLSTDRVEIRKPGTVVTPR